MSANSKRVQEMEVINYVYRLSQAVKRLDIGRAVSRHEMDSLLEQHDYMSAAALELQPVYPELHRICQRMSLRLSMLLGDGEAPPRWNAPLSARATAE